MGEKKSADLEFREIAEDDTPTSPTNSQDGQGESPRSKKKKKKDGENQSNVSNYIRILRLGDKLDSTLMAICAVCAIGAGVAMPMMFLVFGRLVGDFTGYFTPGTSVTKEQFKRAINQNTLYMVYIGIARFALSFISMFSIRISGLRICARLRLDYMKALFRQSVSSIDEISAGAIASRLTANSITIESGISQQFSLGIQAISFTIGLYVVALVKNAILTLVATVSIPIVLVAYVVALPFMYKYLQQGDAIRDQASSLVFEVFQSIRIVKAFGAETRLGRRHAEIIRRSESIDRKQAPIVGMLMAPMMLAVYGIFAFTLWYGIKQYASGRIEGIGTIVIVLFCVLWVVMCVYRLYNPIIQMTRAAAASKEIFAIIDAKVPDPSGKKGISIDQDILFRNVTFAYPTRPDAIILDDLTVRFERGKNTAIVGPSGCGKSTIVAMLERWYQPSETLTGAQYAEGMEIDDKPSFDTSADHEPTRGIYIGSNLIRELDVKWWRSNIGLVQQEPFLFNDTIYNNVAYGLVGTIWEEAPEEEKRSLVRKACQESYADEFISRLPQGYDTKVGEGGGMLISGGQRQRVAIARAIIKQPKILILDEATSSIDIRAERIVQKALDRVSKSRTTITIAHRLSTIKKADKIIVLRDGKVVEEGTHEQLLQIRGVYKALVQAQDIGAGAGDAEDLNIEISDSAELSTIAQSSSAEKRVDGSSQPGTPERKSRGFFRSFGFLLYEQRSHWILYSLTVLGAMGGGATYPLQAYLFAKAISVFTLPKQRLVERGNFWALMFAAQAFGVAIAFFVMGWASTIISTVIASGYRQEYLENLLRKPISYFDQDGNSAGSITSRLSTDSIAIQGLLGIQMGVELVGLLGIIGSIIISFVFGWKFALVGILTAMPIQLMAGYYRVHLESAFAKLNEAVFAETAQFGTEVITAFRTVTALTIEDSITNRFDTLLKEHFQKALRKARLLTIVFAFSDSAEMLSQALIFWYGGRLLADREYDIVQFFVIYMAVVQTSTGAGMWFSMSPNIAEATAAANRIIHVRPSLEDRRKKPDIPKGGRPASIQFHDVHFKYLGRDMPVLRGVNIKIQPGQFAAFVGASGSGKSTMISLLERFYDPSSGRILVDGRDISELDPGSYRKNLSLVAQESTLYDGTIAENVSLSIPPEDVTDAAVEEACKTAQIHDFIVSLPDGYATQIGPRGIALSGGQKQRLALARALLRRPQILLLDEATSNLDSTSEQLVQEAIEREAGRSTVIAVAHRLATIQNADVIFVLGSGRVLESGSHSHLIAKRGIYYQMCKAQALDR